MYVEATTTKHQRSLLTDHMKYYQEYLKCKYESLEITSPDEMLDCYSPQYIDLILIKDHQRKPIRHRRGDMAKLSDENAGVGINQGNDSEYVSLSQALDVEGKKKKTILIEGGPGMGKTTLAINICKCWAKDELLQSYDAVILLTLRDPEIQEAKTISELLLIPDNEMRDSMFKEIMKSYGERICFIFEGFDELPNQLCNSPVFAKVTEKLPKCMLIYTSRPDYFFSTNFCQTIEINGFAEKSIDEYILKAFENELNGEKMALELQSQVHSNPEIQKMLYVPINVAIVCLIFFHFSRLPKTLTELYTLLCLRLILRHIIKRTPNVEQVRTLNSLMNLPEGVSKQFSELCYIGYKGMCSEKIIFSSDDLSDMNVIEDKISGLGLLMVAPSTSVYGVKKSYSFLHLTLQEFCAAWYLSKLSAEEQSQCFSSYLDYNFDHYMDNISGIKSDAFWKFYSGITQLVNIDIDSVLSHESVSSPYFEHKLFSLIKLISEIDNYLLCKKVGDHLDGIFDFYHCIDTENVQSLSYFFRHFKGKLTYIEYQFDRLNNNLFESLIESLKERVLLDNSVKVEFSSLTLSTQSFSTFANLLTVHQYPVVELYFNFCMYEEYLRFLPHILHCSKSLVILDIKHCYTGCEIADCLANCKEVHLQELRLAFCQLGSLGADKIGIMLSHNSSILSIDLSHNEIDDNGVERLAYHLKDNITLQCLDLQGNKITPLGALCLREIINKLDCIKLSYNHSLGHVGIYLILEALTVVMEHISLCGRDASYSFKSFSAILHRVKSINFTAPGDYEDCKIICESIGNSTVLEELEISGISDSNHPTLLNAIGQNNNIKILEINYEVFTDEYAAELATFVKTHKFLLHFSVYVSEELSPKGFLLIADALTENISITHMNIITHYYCRIDPEILWEFLYRLKQANTLKCITLSVSIRLFVCLTKSYSRIKLHQEVFRLIQQINYTRSIKGIDPLELNISDY